MINNGMFTYISTAISLFVALVVPLLIFFTSRHYSKTDIKRAEMLELLKDGSSKMARIESKIDAHIVWHLNGDEK